MKTLALPVTIPRDLFEPLEDIAHQELQGTRPGIRCWAAWAQKGGS